MNLKTGLLLAGVAIVVVAGAVYFGQQSGTSQKTVAQVAPAPLATPPGITLQFLGVGAQGYAPQDHMVVVLGPETAYANDKGLTLYTYDKDTAGKSNCTADCAKAWPPAVAPANAVPAPGWSVIAREDGIKQWALDGKPLYTFSKDQNPGEVAGDGIGPQLRFADDHYSAYRMKVQKVPVPEGWHVAAFHPTQSLVLPQGISARELGDANGQVLINAVGMTLYAFAGDPDHDRPACAAPPCLSHWVPAAAAQLAEPTGDFTVIGRQDGIQQWAYKGQALYTYDGDLQPTYANGIGVDKQYQVAQVVKYFMPAEVTIRPTPGRGNTLADAATGLTLYKRDGFAFASGGGHSYRHGVPNRPAVGRYIGPKGCDADCTKTWHPLKAPAGAQPSGYWDVVARDDGSKQWSYQGYPLYTYAGDKKPGDISGNDIYDIALIDDPNKKVDVGVPMPGSSALYWAFMAP